jgi:type VI secretion system protein ImpA
MSFRSLPFEEAVLLDRWSLEKNGGESLRYSSVYDQIKEARFQEDETLSRGIWNRELKKADWLAVEKICGGVLASQSRDFRVLGWLMEAWIHLDGFEGFSRGLRVLTHFLIEFWTTGYPSLAENWIDEDPLEERQQIVQWIKKMWGEQLVLITLAPSSYLYSSSPVTLADWRFAMNLDVLSKRSQDGHKIVEEAIQNGQKTLQTLREHFKIVPVESFEQQLELLDTISEIEFQEFLKAFTEKFPDSSLSFQDIQNLLKEIQTNLQAGLDLSRFHQNQINRDSTREEETSRENYAPQRTPENDSFSGPEEVTNRSEVYKALKEISGLMESIDPHSLALPLLQMLSQWEHQTLLQILTDLPKQKPEIKAVIRLMASVLTED